MTQLKWKQRLSRLGHGTVAHDAVERIAVRIESRLGKLVAKIDQMMVGQRRWLVTQRTLDRFDDLERLILAASSRPYMQREVMLAAVLGAGAPIADHTLTKSDEGKARRLQRVVIDARAAEKRSDSRGAYEGLIDAALEGPTRNFRHGESSRKPVNQDMGCRSAPCQVLADQHIFAIRPRLISSLKRHSELFSNYPSRLVSEPGKPAKAKDLPAVARCRPRERGQADWRRP